MSRDIDPRLTREEVVRTLARVLTVWEPAFPYRLVGTAAALLQGVELPARDIAANERRSTGSRPLSPVSGGAGADYGDCDAVDRISEPTRRM